MFAFLRRWVKPQLIAPLLSVEWDGSTLTLALAADEGASEAIAIDQDGSYFASAPVDRQGRVRFVFPFPPSGHASYSLLPRRSRDGAALAATALQVVQGRAGVTVASTKNAAMPMLAPLEPARRVPFGVDVATPEVAIVVPVYNATALVERCLDALLAHTHGNVRLIVIDDASTDPAVAVLLARHAERMRVLYNDTNRGFTATANRGIAEAGRADVVLLNADTQVGPNWLAGLRRAAYAAEDVATATAVSDNAGAFSVPELERENALPSAWTPEQSARALWQQAGLAHPELPTGNGFCLYIRRSVFDAVGVLDEAAFPQGYGEENDFCQRASQRGLRHVVAGNVLVRHARSASFGDERRAALGRAGMTVLRERWPRYEDDVARTLYSFERRVLDWRVRRVFAGARADNAPKARLLWVGAGAPEWRDAEVWNLRANGARNELVFDGRVVAVNEWVAHDPEPSYRALWDWLQSYAIEQLIVAERKESAAEILCRLLDIPVTPVAQPFAATAAAALQTAESAFRPHSEGIA